MNICQNCKKVIEVNELTDSDTPRLCPYCRQDARFGPVGRVINGIRDNSPIVLAVVFLVAVGVAWFSGAIRF